MQEGAAAGREFGVWSVAALLCCFWAAPTRVPGMSVVLGGWKRTKVKMPSVLRV